MKWMPGCFVKGRGFHHELFLGELPFGSVVVSRTSAINFEFH